MTRDLSLNTQFKGYFEETEYKFLIKKQEFLYYTHWAQTFNAKL